MRCGGRSGSWLFLDEKANGITSIAIVISVILGLYQVSISLKKTLGSIVGIKTRKSKGESFGDAERVRYVHGKGVIAGSAELHYGAICDVVGGRYF